MSIGTNLGVFLTNYNNTLGNENYENIKNANSEALKVGKYDNKKANELANNLAKFDAAMLAATPPSRRADIMWQRNLWARACGKDDIYPPAEVCKAQYAPYV